MSKHINVNPDHYKLAGRERQGENIIQTVERQAYAAQRAEAERWQARQRENPQPRGETPEPREKPQPRKKARRKARTTAPKPPATRRAVKPVRKRVRKPARMKRTTTRSIRARSRRA